MLSLIILTAAFPCQLCIFISGTLCTLFVLVLPVVLCIRLAFGLLVLVVLNVGSRCGFLLIKIPLLPGFNIQAILHQADVFDRTQIFYFL